MPQRCKTHLEDSLRERLLEVPAEGVRGVDSYQLALFQDPVNTPKLRDIHLKS